VPWGQTWASPLFLLVEFLQGVAIAITEDLDVLLNISTIPLKRFFHSLTHLRIFALLDNDRIYSRAWGSVLEDGRIDVHVATSHHGKLSEKGFQMNEDWSGGISLSVEAEASLNVK
jgi:hypothetical protein